MSWDWNTTRAVLDARVQCSVYPELPTPEYALKARLLAELETGLEPVLGKGARLHPEDVEVRTVPGAVGHGLLVQMRWRPSVQTVELLGGHHDGLVVAVPEPLGLHSSGSCQTPRSGPSRCCVTPRSTRTCRSPRPRTA